MPSTTATPTPPDTPGDHPVRVLGHEEASGSGEREVLVVRDTGGKPRGKGYAAIPSRDDGEEEREGDDVEGKVVNRVRPPFPIPFPRSPKFQRHTDPSRPQRILTTPLLFTLFLLLTTLTALSLTTAVLLALGAAYDLTPLWGFMRVGMRGTGLEAMWVALIGGWTGLAGMLFVSCVASVASVCVAVFCLVNRERTLLGGR